MKPLHALAKAMKHTLRLFGKWLDLSQRVVERAALVDNTIQACFDCDFKLLLKDFRLLAFLTNIVRCATAL